MKRLLDWIKAFLIRDLIFVLDRKSHTYVLMEELHPRMLKEAGMKVLSKVLLPRGERYYATLDTPEGNVRVEIFDLAFKYRKLIAQEYQIDLPDLISKEYAEWANLHVIKVFKPLPG
jgi:hypothetical protein